LLSRSWPVQTPQPFDKLIFPLFSLLYTQNPTGNDLSCNQKQWDGSLAPWCRVCGGQAAVEEACNKHAECVAFDMATSGEFYNCGYLKRSAGPTGSVPGYDVFTRTGAKAPRQQAPKPQRAAKGGYEKEEGANIPGNDITCGMRQWDNSPAPWCRVCGGEAAVKAACDKNPACVAFDMHTSGEFTNCGYLKSAAGPVSQNWGFASFKRTAAKTPTQQQESKPEDHAHSGFQDYQQEEGANIPGNDISCGMRQWDSSAAPWCRVSDGFG